MVVGEGSGFIDYRDPEVILKIPSYEARMFFWERLFNNEMLIRMGEDVAWIPIPEGRIRIELEVGEVGEGGEEGEEGDLGRERSADTGRGGRENRGGTRRGGDRSCRGKFGARGGSKLSLNHIDMMFIYVGSFVARGKENLLVTENLVVEEPICGEKRILVEDKDGNKVEYRVWNPFRSRLAADILGGLDNIYISSKSKVLYLGASIRNYGITCCRYRWPAHGSGSCGEPVNNSIKEYCVATEKYTDGGLHVHAFIQMERNFETRNARFFDVVDNHPNASPRSKTPRVTTHRCGKSHYIYENYKEDYYKLPAVTGTVVGFPNYFG
ncbi:904_t:CDS:2 [Diversispora eburnea]|uniref:rRNA 2'-O-methyltransferase fibrillarin n=1 Tax=Diversispora eburnea TaxID=1213867 RepID=A0A9N8VTJ7_9GLOM|nr:904_t:CDS:2 [Diversispora eburnea]